MIFATECVAVSQEVPPFPSSTFAAVQKGKRFVAPTRPSNKATVVDANEELSDQMLKCEEVKIGEYVD